jgi:hypothetical protein
MPRTTRIAHEPGDQLLAAGFQRVIRPCLVDRRFAVLLRLLSSSDEYALKWIHMRLQQQNRWKEGLILPVSSAVLDAWCTELRSDSFLIRCLSTPGCYTRGEAHLFLAESLLSERIKTFLAGGLLVPSGYIVQRYVKLLEALPPAAPILDACERLKSKPQASKKWMRRFRDHWSMEWGTCSVPHGIGESIQKARAGIYYRWLLWAEEAAGGEVAFVNMDETQLNNVRARVCGNRSSAAGAEVIASTIIRKERALPRTSLLAMVCSHDALQAVLPQVRLIQSKDGTVPSRQVLEAYAHAGQPQVARHGGSGWASRAVLGWWMTALKKAVKSVRPQAQIILVWDAAGTHLSNDVLLAAKRRGIRVVFIPAKMTWKLQPLDTDVFSSLKNHLRHMEFSARAETPSMLLQPLQRVVLQGQAIHQVLVQKSWSHVLRRAGMGMPFEDIRPSLKQLLQTECRAPRKPSDSELQEVLQVPPVRVPQLMDLLFWSVQAPVIGDAVPAGTSAAPTSLGAVAARLWSGARVVPRPLVLRTGARLPSGLPSGQPASNVWMPLVGERQVITRSVSRRALASGSQSSAPAPPDRPAKRRRGA